VTSGGKMASYAATLPRSSVDYLGLGRPLTDSLGAQCPPTSLCVGPRLSVSSISIGSAVSARLAVVTNPQIPLRNAFQLTEQPFESFPVCGDPDPRRRSARASSGPDESTPPTGSLAVQPLLRSTQTNPPVDYISRRCKGSRPSRTSNVM